MKTSSAIQAALLSLPYLAYAQSAGLRPPPTYGMYTTILTNFMRTLLSLLQVGTTRPLAKTTTQSPKRTKTSMLSSIRRHFYGQTRFPLRHSPTGHLGQLTRLYSVSSQQYNCQRIGINLSLDDFLRGIASRHDWFNYQIADFKSEQGRPIFTAFLSDPNSKPSNSTKLRVWLQAAIHGNEPAADQGAMALLGKMDANTTWTASLLEKMDIFVMPRYNPDGVRYFQR
jgi:hypothetical protein